MSDLFPMSQLEASHHAYDVFLFTLEALASPAEQQCELIGDFNTAWQLRDEAMAGQYLMNYGLFDTQQAAAVRAFIALMEPVPVDSLPSGAGRAVNLAAMQNPLWEPIRSQAQQLLKTLAPVTAINKAFLDQLEAA